MEAELAGVDGVAGIAEAAEAASAAASELSERQDLAGIAAAGSTVDAGRSSAGGGHAEEALAADLAEPAGAVADQAAGQ